MDDESIYIYWCTLYAYIHNLMNSSSEGDPVIREKTKKQIHCKTHEVGNSAPGLAIYMRYFVPLWLENHPFIISLINLLKTYIYVLCS